LSFELVFLHKKKKIKTKKTMTKTFFFPSTILTLFSQKFTEQIVDQKEQNKNNKKKDQLQWNIQPHFYWERSIKLSVKEKKRKKKKKKKKKKKEKRKRAGFPFCVVVLPLSVKKKCRCNLGKSFIIYSTPALFIFIISLFIIQRISNKTKFWIKSEFGEQKNRICSTKQMIFPPLLLT